MKTLAKNTDSHATKAKQNPKIMLLSAIAVVGLITCFSYLSIPHPTEQEKIVATQKAAAEEEHQKNVSAYLERTAQAQADSTQVGNHFSGNANCKLTGNTTIGDNSSNSYECDNGNVILTLNGKIVSKGEH
jgi:hypothetical protein